MTPADVAAMATMYGVVALFIAILGTLTVIDDGTDWSVPEAVAISALWPFALLATIVIGVVRLARRAGLVREVRV